jgi:hypothetical protein
MDSVLNEFDLLIINDHRGKEIISIFDLYL